MKKKTEDPKDVKKDDEKQSQKFVEVARALEADETGKSFEKEGILFISTPGVVLSDDNLQFSVFVGIGDVDVVKGKPAVAFLNQALSITSSIIDAVEAESIRIGLI